MTVRRMTAEDYEEAGVEPPCTCAGVIEWDHVCPVHGPNAPASAPRCEACGDERGECLCHDD